MIPITKDGVEIIREEEDMRPIKEGDIVTVCMARGGCFDFQIGPEIHDVTVLHSPVDTGDLWYFRTGGEDGIEFAVNPCSSDFIRLILEDNSGRSEIKKLQDEIQRLNDLLDLVTHTEKLPAGDA